MSASKEAVLPDMSPEPVFTAEQLVFSAEEKAKIQSYRDRYPTPESAVMRALWVAQEKFGWLPPEVIKLTAEEIGIPYALAYGVATFYTQYYKEKMGTYVLDVCTCFSCQMVGGYDIMAHLEEQLEIHDGQTTADGRFSIRGVECLGSCGSGPMLQVTNGPFVHNLTPAKIDALIEDLKQDKMPPFVSMTLPQDEDEMGGNRRTDVPATETYVTPPMQQNVK